MPNRPRRPRLWLTGKVKPLLQRRPHAAARGYGYRWQKASRAWLKKEGNRICLRCYAAHRLTPAKVVDHILPHRGDMVIFWNPNNWQPMCKPCHDWKTAVLDKRIKSMEDGLRWCDWLGK